MTGVRILLDNSAIQKIAFFESVTRVNLKDCIDEDEDITFVLKAGDFRKAFGNKGANLRVLEKKFNKRIIFLEFDHDPKKFAQNLLKPIQVKSVELVPKDDNSTIMHIMINTSQRAFPSKKVKKTKTLLMKYFPNIVDVIVKV